MQKTAMARVSQKVKEGDKSPVWSENPISAESFESEMTQSRGPSRASKKPPTGARDSKRSKKSEPPVDPNLLPGRIGSASVLQQETEHNLIEESFEVEMSVGSRYSLIEAPAESPSPKRIEKSKAVPLQSDA